MLSGGDGAGSDDGGDKVSLISSLYGVGGIRNGVLELFFTTEHLRFEFNAFFASAGCLTSAVIYFFCSLPGYLFSIPSNRVQLLS